MDNLGKTANVTSNSARSARVLIVAACSPDNIDAALVKGATAALSSADATYEVIKTSGIFEISTTIRLATAAKHFDGFVALGCIERDKKSDTKSLYANSLYGLTMLGVEGVCIGNGISHVKATDKAKTTFLNDAQTIGKHAAETTLNLIDVKRRFTKTGTTRISPTSEHILMAGEAKDNQGIA